jgi:DNA polymerase III subunit gamma/tau
MTESGTLLKQGLSRRLRPHHFDDVVGQTLIIKALQNVIDQQCVNPVMLFSGTRGVGKTTLARIVAQAIQCETPQSGSPCRSCAACLSMQKGGMIDLLEVDAASKNKVEDIRALLDQMQYVPHEGRYKVLILDEVHMLSNHSFNVLLKILEEPLPHQLFMMATTDPQKLPETVLSRCMHFQLKPISDDDLNTYLQSVCARESVACEAQAIDLLVNYARGSIRDVLSLLDQLLALTNNVTAAHVTSMIGTIADQRVDTLMRAVSENDWSLAQRIAQECYNADAQFDLVLPQMMRWVHDQLCQSTKTVKQVDESLQIDKAQLHLYYDLILKGLKTLSWAPSPYLGFRMILQRLCYLSEKNTSSEALAQVPSHSHQPKRPMTNSPMQSEKKTTEKKTDQNVPPNRSGSLPLTAEAWSDIFPNLGLTGLSLALCAQLFFIKIEGKICYFSISKAHAPILNPRVTQKIEEAISSYCGSRYSLKITTKTDIPSEQVQADRTERNPKKPVKPEKLEKKEKSTPKENISPKSNYSVNEESQATLAHIESAFGMAKKKNPAEAVESEPQED